MESPFVHREGVFAETKSEVRRRIRLQLRAHHSEIARRSRALCSLIRKTEEWRSALTVGLFAPLPDEPNLLDLLQDGQKRFIFPRISGECLSWHQVRDLGCLRAGDACGLPLLREPADSNIVELREADLLLVPGLAFTREGARLGRGRGFYDRALASVALRPTLIGVCFTFQVLPTLPIEGHDRRVQKVFSA